MRWRVGIADSGIDLSIAPDRPRVIASRSFVRERGIQDSLGHGAACWAAFEAALAFHRVDGACIDVVYAKIFSGVSDRCSTSKLAAAVSWLAQQQARIIALPCGSVEPCPRLSRAVGDALACGAIVVAAAGRSERQLYPAACEGVVCVGAGDLLDSSRSVFFATARVLALEQREQ
jgi:hypothetical protein